MSVLGTLFKIYSLTSSGIFAAKLADDARINVKTNVKNCSYWRLSGLSQFFLHNNLNTRKLI